MLPTKETAHMLLAEAEKCNPGPWGNHSRIAAHCAQAIALACNMNADKAYVLGLLHDIGRKFGVRHLGHVSDGYAYMRALGYDEVARICLTHSFNNRNMDEFIGKNDVSEEEYRLIHTQLQQLEPDDFDQLIQLCDALAGSSRVLDVEERMLDVKARYGFYPKAKWDKNLQLLQYFSQKAHKDVYTIVDKDHFSL